MQGIRSKFPLLAHVLQLNVRNSRILGVHFDLPAPTIFCGFGIHIALNNYVAREQGNFSDSINADILKTLTLTSA